MELRNWFKAFLVLALMVTNVSIEKQFTPQKDGKVVASWGFAVNYNSSYAMAQAQH